MNILKKLLGIITLLLTLFLSCGLIYAHKITFFKAKRKFEEENIGAPGYAIGFIITFCLSVIVIYFLTRLGLKLLRNKKISINPIDEIGTQY